jgi:23S rRNA (uracil1939-C5)-methyltransferase
MAVSRSQVKQPPGLKPHETVTVHGIAAGGDGVGTLPDGRVIFLPRTAPGDEVRVRLFRMKDRWGRGEVVDWIRKGPGRVPPPCPQYSRCDGCSLQHLDYEEQLKWKGRLVGDALRRIGGLETEDPEVAPAPEELRYRNKVTYTLRRLAGGRLVAGFRSRTHQGKVLDLGVDCLLPEERLMEVWGGLREGWGPGAFLLPAGRELRLTLRSGSNGVGLLIRGGRGNGDPRALLAQVPGLISVWREEKGGSLSFLAGEEALRVEWLRETLEIPGGGFLQVNTRGGEGLHEYVLEEAGAVAGLVVVDAYCGVGTLGRALAERGARVVGIESDSLGVKVGRSRAAEGHRFVEGRVEDELANLLPVDLLLVNPPRSGLDESIPGLLSEHMVRRVIYVSCDPATLARDLKRLGPRFQVEKVRSFDLFPQTAHVETVTMLTGKDA